ncbi:unnamed protein product [Parnassius apollo]|uniref:(apollo) hypothetical protein n=1 Tax=Parnassius apollo TaxID=110799 RepID=A0A8S3X793_PARAO|nr:unnamed protein product [Parnassius apollo]
MKADTRQSSHRHTSLGSDDIDPKLLQLSRESVRTSLFVLKASIFATSSDSIKERGRAGDRDLRGKSGDRVRSIRSGDRGRCREKSSDRSGDSARSRGRSGDIGHDCARSVDDVRDNGGVTLLQWDDVIFVARICNVLKPSPH